MAPAVESARRGAMHFLLGMSAMYVISVVVTTRAGLMLLL